MARALDKAGAHAVLIKGGHLGALSGSAAQSIDLFYDGRDFVELRAARFPAGAHEPRMRAVGGDRRLSRAWDDLITAVRHAKRYVTAALCASFTLGAGRAVLDHFARK